MCCNRLRWLPKFLNFAVHDLNLLRVGNRNFCFANNSGAFPETMKMAIKRAKMCVIRQLKNATQSLIRAFGNCIQITFLLDNYKEIKENLKTK